MSIRAARRSIDPSFALPPVFRTLSFGVDEANRRSFAKDEKPTKSKKDKKSKQNSAQLELGSIDYHKSTIDELIQRFSTSRGTGISDAQAAQKIKEIGRNVPTPPPSRWFQQTIGYLFGGFGTILFVASILVFASWKPLGTYL